MTEHLKVQTFTQSAQGYHWDDERALLYVRWLNSMGIQDSGLTSRLNENIGVGEYNKLVHDRILSAKRT